MVSFIKITYLRNIHVFVSQQGLINTSKLKNIATLKIATGKRSSSIRLQGTSYIINERLCLGLMEVLK